MSKEIFDDVTSHAYGIAAYHLQNTIFTLLMAKGILTMKEVALIFAGTIDALEKLRVAPEAEETIALAKLALQKSVVSWETQARGN